MKGRNKGFTLVELLVVAAIIAAIFSFSVPLWTKGELVAKVTDKARIVETSGKNVSSKYLIYTDKETLEDTDCWLFWKFNSSDVYGRLEKDKVYKFKVYGFRVPFFSWYRNIIEVQEGMARWGIIYRRKVITIRQRRFVRRIQKHSLFPSQLRSVKFQKIWGLFVLWTMVHLRRLPTVIVKKSLRRLKHQMVV